MKRGGGALCDLFISQSVKSQCPWGHCLRPLSCAKGRRRRPRPLSCAKGVYGQGRRKRPAQRGRCVARRRPPHGGPEPRRRRGAVTVVVNEAAPLCVRQRGRVCSVG